MSEQQPAVSVIIPCRNERGRIEECLRFVLAQEEPQGGFEVIVADGMSDDGTRDVLERLTQADRRLRVIDNPGRIVSTGLNAAIRIAKAAVIVRMDAHTEYAADYIRQCVAVLEETGADIAGGPWVAKGEGYVSRAIAAAFQSPFSAGGARGHDPGHEGRVDIVYLGCWRREVFDRIGCFDEELVRNQDDEHNLRLTRAGGRIWQSPRIRSWYKPRGSLSALFCQYLQYGYWKVRVIRKHKLLASWRHLVPAMFVFWALAGWMSFLIHPWLGAAYVTVLGTYALLTLLFSVQASARCGAGLLPLLPFVFLVYHVGYGSGFLLGLLDFVLLRRSGRASMGALTRAAASSESTGATPASAEGDWK